MQMKRTLQTKSKVSHSDDGYAMLVQMMNQVKAEAGGQSYAQVTPEVKEKLDEMMIYIEQIMEAIREQQVAAQNELIRLMTDLTNRAEATRSHYTTAVSADNDNIDCRDNEKAALKEWEECIVTLESCYVTVVQECDDYEESYKFQLGKDHLDSNNEYTCDFATMKSSTRTLPEEASNYGWLDNAYMCNSYHWVWEQLQTFQDEWQAGFTTYLAEKEHCTETVPADCAEKAHTCAALWRAYLDLHLECTTDCDTAKNAMCAFGTKYTDQCDQLDLFVATRTEIEEDSTIVEGQERTQLSEADRMHEYVAVVKIRCLIQDYVEGGNWLGNTEQCEGDAVYGTEIGPFDYLKTELDAALDPWNCDREPTKHTVDSIVFSTSMYAIGRASVDYVKNGYSSKALLDGSAPFSFCSTGWTGTEPTPSNMCLQHEACGQYDITVPLNSFATPEAALLSHWIIEPMGESMPLVEASCKDLFHDESLCLLPPASGGSVFVSRELAGPGVFEIYWGNFKEAPGDNTVYLTLTTAEGEAVHEAGSFERTIKTTFECTQDCKMELKTSTGELILHTISVTECQGDVTR